MENNKDYNPDVLNCIANLSNDEVFTPPQLVNEMLDLLPQELFSNPKARFLDPFTKSGVFLREIVKRLDVGLSGIIPDRQERILHIMHNQIFGIALTELTSLLARRTVYCSKYADSEHSIGRFKTKEGYILYTPMQHSWQNGRCQYCGASKEVFDRGDAAETYAYNFIHTNNPEKFFPNMTFDVIIGNPPYQMDDGGAQASAIPLYHKFVEQAKKLKPRYLSMIIPARWMTGGRGLNTFRKTMIHDNKICVLHDYTDASECFSGVEIKGGVCYFLRDESYSGKCHIYKHHNKETRESFRFLVEPGDEIFVREERLISIKEKVTSKEFTSFDTIVSSMKPYGLRGDFFNSPSKYNLPKVSETPIKDGYTIMGLEDQRRTQRYISRNYPIPNIGLLNFYKIFITRNWGIGSFEDIPSSPIIARPNELCTETFIEIGPFKSEQEAQNVLTYVKTKFFRALVAIRKQDQGASKAVYHYVPLQDFSEPWTDEKLYKKYNLSEEEIAFIESMIRPME